MEIAAVTAIFDSLRSALAICVMVCFALRPGAANDLREARPDVIIIICNDGGFCRRRLIRWSDRNHADDTLGIRQSAVLEGLIEPLIQEAHNRRGKTGEKQKLAADADHPTGTWDYGRRVTIKAERMATGPNERFVITSLDGHLQSLQGDVYCHRGEMNPNTQPRNTTRF